MRNRKISFNKLIEAGLNSIPSALDEVLTDLDFLANPIKRAKEFDKINLFQISRLFDNPFTYHISHRYKNIRVEVIKYTGYLVFDKVSYDGEIEGAYCLSELEIEDFICYEDGYDVEYKPDWEYNKNLRYYFLAGFSRVEEIQYPSTDPDVQRLMEKGLWHEDMW